MMRVNRFLASGMSFAEAAAARRAEREANAAANAAKRAERAAAVKHCQICGRQILANSGLIAHHGYQRPGHGWQTASCFGARWRPYEVACDALPSAIDGLGKWIAAREAALAKWIAEPPPGIEARPRSSRMNFRPHTMLRPTDFDPNDNRSISFIEDRSEYRRLHGIERANMESEIRHANADLNRLRARLADWKPMIRANQHIGEKHS